MPDLVAAQAETHALHKHADVILCTHALHKQGPPLTTVFGPQSSAFRRAVWPGSGRGLMVVGGSPHSRRWSRTLSLI